MGKSIRKEQEFPAQQAPALNTKIIYDIPLTADLERLVVSLSGVVTLTAVATALKKDGICELIQSVDLIANGSDTIVSVPFAQIVQGNMFRRNSRNAPPLTQPGLAIAAQPFKATGVIDLAAYGVIRPKDTSVRETAYKTLQLAVRFADFASVFTGGTVSASTLAMLVQADETIEMPDATGAASAPIMRPLISYREDSVTGAVTRQRFRLTPEQALRGLTLRAMDATGNVCSDAVLSRVRVYTGTMLRYDKISAAIRDKNQNEMNGGVPTGYYYINFAAQGESADRLNDCYDLRAAAMGGADAYIEYDSAAAMTLCVTQHGYTVF